MKDLDVMDQQQKTIKKTVIFTGKGLHSGRMVRMEVIPAPLNHGVKFLRTDADSPILIDAHAANITATELCTTLGSGRNSVGTIEHLMAAFAGLGIDNALVRLNGPEVPILDGSAKPYVADFAKVGLEEQGAIRRYFIVKEAFEYRDGDRYIKVEPSRETKYQCSIDFGKGYIGKQKIDYTHDAMNFKKLSYARTFCHINEVNALRNAGLAQGGSLENAVVVTDDGVVNEEGLRCDDEFVRHKLLDCIGDLYLLGGPLVAKITIEKPGHGFHSDFMNKILLHKHKYFSIVEPKEFSREEKVAFAYAGGIAFS